LAAARSIIAQMTTKRPTTRPTRRPIIMRTTTPRTFTIIIRRAMTIIMIVRAILSII
jgi:hypothetical protein